MVANFFNLLILLTSLPGAIVAQIDSLRSGKYLNLGISPVITNAEFSGPENLPWAATPKKSTGIRSKVSGGFRLKSGVRFGLCVNFQEIRIREDYDTVGMLEQPHRVYNIRKSRYLGPGAEACVPLFSSGKLQIEAGAGIEWLYKIDQTTKLHLNNGEIKRYKSENYLYPLQMQLIPATASVGLNYFLSPRLATSISLWGSTHLKNPNERLFVNGLLNSGFKLSMLLFFK